MTPERLAEIRARIIQTTSLYTTDRENWLDHDRMIEELLDALTAEREHNGQATSEMFADAQRIGYVCAERMFQKQIEAERERADKAIELAADVINYVSHLPHHPVIREEFESRLKDLER